MAPKTAAIPYDTPQVRALLEHVRDYAIFVLDTGGHVVTWNAGARTIKGYAEPEIIGQHIAVFYTDEERSAEVPAQLLMVAARDGRVQREGWRVRKGGSRFWADVVITALKDDAGALVGFLKVTRDLTERRNAEAALRQTEESLAATLYSIGDAVISTDARGQVMRLNPVAERLTGWREAEAIGRPIGEVFAIVNEETARRPSTPSTGFWPKGWWSAWPTTRPWWVATGPNGPSPTAAPRFGRSTARFKARCWCSVTCLNSVRPKKSSRNGRRSSRRSPSWPVRDRQPRSSADSRPRRRVGDGDAGDRLGLGARAAAGRPAPVGARRRGLAGRGRRTGVDFGKQRNLAGAVLAAGYPLMIEVLAVERRFSDVALLTANGVVSGLAVVIPVAGENGRFGALGTFSRQRMSFSRNDVSFFQAVANLVASAVRAPAPSGTPARWKRSPRKKRKRACGPKRPSASATSSCPSRPTSSEHR